jgi:hypothetical protein
MTSHIPHALSEQVARHRGEPAAARTFNWHPGQGASGIVSLRLDCEIFHTRKAWANCVTKARPEEHQAIAGHSPYIRLTHLVFPDECGKGSSVAIGPAVALNTSVIFFITPPRQHGSARRGRGATWDRDSSTRNLAPPSWSTGSRSVATSMPRCTSRLASRNRTATSPVTVKLAPGRTRGTLTNPHSRTRSTRR